jgi:hypothetical protein
LTTYSQPVNESQGDAVCRRLHLPMILLVCLALASSAFGQVTFHTGRSDNQRTGANTNETLLTPGNVNGNSFGHLFNYSLDYQALAQPLYVPNVAIPGKGTHNVLYVATMADTVYAFDADNNEGSNASPLWSVNFTDPAHGVTLASYSDNTLPCTNADSTGPGFNQEGIVSTPAIDAASGTLYAVAKTVENGTVRHRIHALDIATGQEKFGGPVLITATSISNAGNRRDFNSLHQKNRPGLLLVNGILYLAFGSNYCNDSNTGWILSYDATSLQQLGVFNTSPDKGLTSIWQTGQGLTADADGNIYALTGEGKFDAPQGGQGYGNSILKLSGNPLALTDYFTPWNVLYLNSHDLDLSSSGAILLPDQTGPHAHILIAAAKEGTIYVLNRDNLGQFNPNGDSQIVQELPLAVGSMFDSPAYWNGMVYFAGNADSIKGFSVADGQLSALPIVTSAQKYVGSHSPSISAHGNTNGIVWVISGQRLYAFDALSLQLLYNTAKAEIPQTAHFATQTVVNGRVYVATRTSLEVYGLRPALTLLSGGDQTATVFTPLANPIQIRAADPYSGAPAPGVTVTFSDGGKGGTFNPSSAATDSSGQVSTIYTVPKRAGTYTITVAAAGFATATLRVTATPGPPVKLTLHAGNKQTAPAGTVLPVPLSAKVVDAYGNGIPGISVTLDDQGKGGVPNPNPCVTDALGLTSVQYQLPTKPGTYTLKPTAAGLKSPNFLEYAVTGPAASIAVTGGNDQTAPAGTLLPQALTVLVADQYGNPVSGAGVTFGDGGAGGSFSSNPVNTDNTGTATQSYTLPPVAGTVSITATAPGVGTPATFTETAQ